MEAELRRGPGPRAGGVDAFWGCTVLPTVLDAAATTPGAGPVLQAACAPDSVGVALVLQGVLVPETGCDRCWEPSKGAGRVEPEPAEAVAGPAESWRAVCGASPCSCTEAVPGALVEDFSGGPGWRLIRATWLRICSMSWSWWICCCCSATSCSRIMGMATAPTVPPVPAVPPARAPWENCATATLVLSSVSSVTLVLGMLKAAGSGCGGSAGGGGGTPGPGGPLSVDASTSMGSASFAVAFTSLPSVGATSSATSLSVRSLGELAGEGSGKSSEGGAGSSSCTISTSGFLVQVFLCCRKSAHLKNSAQHFSHTLVSSLPLLLSLPLSASSAPSPGTPRKPRDYISWAQPDSALHFKILHISKINIFYFVQITPLQHF